MEVNSNSFVICLYLFSFTVLLLGNPHAHNAKTPTEKTSRNKTFERRMDLSQLFKTRSSSIRT